MTAKRDKNVQREDVWPAPHSVSLVLGPFPLSPPLSLSICPKSSSSPTPSPIPSSRWRVFVAALSPS